MSAGNETGQGGLREPLLTFLVATGLAAVLFQTARVVPWVQQVLHAGIAVIFLYAPQLASRLSGRPFDVRDAGLTLAPVGRGLATLARAILVTWPPFLLAFLLFYSFACPPGSPAFLHGFTERFAPVCGGWQGWQGARLRLPPDLALLAVSQLLVVALPEELFFRGYLQPRLEERWPPRHRLWGAPVGLALVVGAALFALGHLLVDFHPGRVAVFLPGLVFGWMRARSGSLAAGIVFHALCNLLSDVLFHSFFAFP